MPRYIDAELLESKYREGTDPQDPYGEINYLLPEDIDSIPTADVQEVRHGHWINGNCGDYVCSVCGWAFSDELPYMAREYDAETEVIMRYCMHCGSRLELQGGEENDTDC